MQQSFLLFALLFSINSSHAMFRALVRPTTAGAHRAVALHSRASIARLPGYSPASFLSSAEKQDNPAAGPDLADHESDPTQLTPQEIATTNNIAHGLPAYSDKQLDSIISQIAMQPGAHNIGRIRQEDVVKQVKLTLERDKLKHLALLLAKPADRPALREKNIMRDMVRETVLEREIVREIEDIKGENGESGNYDSSLLIQAHMLQAQALDRILEQQKAQDLAQNQAIEALQKSLSVIAEQQAAQTKTVAAIQGRLSEHISALDERETGLAEKECRVQGRTLDYLFEILDGIKQIPKKP